MKIVIAPDSFKETLSAQQVATTIQTAFLTEFPHAQFSLLPLADGGEGTLEAFAFVHNAEIKQTVVKDPLGRAITASWGLIDQGKTAVIELASASGLPLLTIDERNPMLASSFGTGQLIAEAVEKGVTKIILGLGGSATNDAGAGMLQALGFQLLDKDKQTLIAGGGALAECESINAESVDPRLANIELVIACDVQNPLCGKQGASWIFGAQKGGTPEQLAKLDEALAHFAEVAIRYYPNLDANLPGMGAAGGAAFSLSIAFSQVKIVSGIDLVLQELDAERIIQGADLVITGEGQMDNQTLNGKTPFGVARLAKQYNLPVIAINGSLGESNNQLSEYFDAILPSLRSSLSHEQLIAEAESNLYRTALNVAKLLKLGATFSEIMD